MQTNLTPAASVAAQPPMGANADCPQYAADGGAAANHLPIGAAPSSLVGKPSSLTADAGAPNVRPHRYSNRLAAAAPARVGFDPDTPIPGCYRIRLARGGPPVALRIWLGPSIDPATGEEVQERGFRWQCAVNGGERVPVEDYWPGCARDPISQAEHDRIVRESRTMDEGSAFFDPKRRIDPLTAPTPF